MLIMVFAVSIIVVMRRSLSMEMVRSDVLMTLVVLNDEQRGRVW